jgi:hypothetical protein
MTLQSVVLEDLDLLLQKNLIASIAGESGTGKSSLAIYLISYSLSKNETCNNSCFWIQASEQFPKNRLMSINKDNSKRCNYLLDNIYIAPNRIFSSYLEQSLFLNKIADDHYLFPPDLKFIVVDNISHHLRFATLKSRDIKHRTALLDDFYNNTLCPLILRCQREHIALILIHEVSFNVKLQKTLPFFNSLYERIRSVNIYLSKSPISKERGMKIEIGKSATTLNFKLDNHGFLFI